MRKGGATLKFDGCGGDIVWSGIKVCFTNVCPTPKGEVLIQCLVYMFLETPGGRYVL